MTNDPIYPLFAMLRRTLDAIDGTADDRAAVRRSIAEAGIEPNCHVGRADLSPIERAEWALGQFASAHDKGALGSGAASAAVKLILSVAYIYPIAVRTP